MKKKLYIAKLRNLSEQINIMLMEAEGLTEASEQMVNNVKMSITKLLKTSFVVKPGKLTELLKLAEENPTEAWKQATAYMKVSPSETKELIAKGTAWQKLGKSIATGAKANLGTIAVSLVTVALVPVLGSLREKLSMKEVKEVTGKAMNAKSYQEAVKYINALKKINSNNSLWSKLTTSQSARDLAETNVNAFKKSYITIGVALCIASLVACIMFGLSVDIIEPLIESAKKLDWGGILSGLGKLAVLGLLAAPAMLGACMIYIGIKGFPEKGIAADVLEALAPVVQIANKSVKSVLEVAELVASQQQA